MAHGAVEAFSVFDVGSWALPSDMLAQVHAGEMIVPAAATPWAQDVMSSSAGGGGGNTNSSTTHNINMTGGFFDANGLAKVVQKTIRNNPSSRPRYR